MENRSGEEETDGGSDSMAPSKGESLTIAPRLSHEINAGHDLDFENPLTEETEEGTDIQADLWDNYKALFHIVDTGHVRGRDRPWLESVIPGIRPHPRANRGASRLTSGLKKVYDNAYRAAKKAP
jgi:hypothetical protein